MNELTD